MVRPFDRPAIQQLDDKTIRLASPGQKPVFLIQAADGTWGVSRKPAN
jgi:hypothetical protein